MFEWQMVNNWDWTITGSLGIAVFSISANINNHVETEQLL
jgi:hypothetical protein